MVKALYMEDCYLKEFNAKVIAIHNNEIELDQTAFYPNSGGQPNDLGTFECKGKTYDVVNVLKDKGRIIHIVENNGLKVGDLVKGAIQWERRHLLMRYHTASHILSTVINKQTGAKITGNQIYLDRARDDFSLQEFDREKMKDYIEETNKVISKALDINIYMLPREEAFKIPELVKLKMILPESIKIIRVVEIDGFDKQACAGTHVKNTSEIGNIELIEVKNKGKNNRRVYWKLIS
jgi:misacylated tRNA(Ala) deacylase